MYMFVDLIYRSLMWSGCSSGVNPNLHPRKVCLAEKESPTDKLAFCDWLHNSRDVWKTWKDLALWLKKK